MTKKLMYFIAQQKLAYVSFGKSQKADDSIQEEGIIKRTKKGKIVGLTILNASRFKN